MAGASMNDIKARIKSVNSTMQITKAMELVAISKLRRAKERAEATRPYSLALENGIRAVSTPEALSAAGWQPNPDAPVLYVVIAGDRGLAGGYNMNVFRKMLQDATDGSVFIPVGKKASDFLRHRSLPTLSGEFSQASEMGVGRCFSLADIVCESFKRGEISAVKVVYTRFMSMISQVAVIEDIFPLSAADNADDLSDPIVDGDPSEVLDKIIPQYLGGRVYSAVCQAIASEHGARRMAMNAANKNATEMIDSLMLGYNRARQAVITQEITEIVSGAEAL
ncbi:MAG: ATP synthase F1 subunit gamma [Clostridia bacterium]|nr:ATP synthase F1 subunit gamma [Clostridia bacterium]